MGGAKTPLPDPLGAAPPRKKRQDRAEPTGHRKRTTAYHCLSYSTWNILSICRRHKRRHRVAGAGLGPVLGCPVPLCWAGGLSSPWSCASCARSSWSCATSCKPRSSARVAAACAGRRPSRCGLRSRIARRCSGTGRSPAASLAAPPSRAWRLRARRDTRCTAQRRAPQPEQTAARFVESSARSTQCTGVGEWAGGGLREVIIRIAARHSTRPAPIPSTSHAAKNWLRIRCGRGGAHGTTPVEWQPPTAMIVSKSPKRGGARVRRARRAG